MNETERGATNPEDALSVIRDTERRLARVHGQGSRRVAWLCIALGVVIGLWHLGIFTFPASRNLSVFLIVNAMGAVAICALMALFIWNRRATPAGSSRRYLIALPVSMLVYSAGVVWNVTGDETLAQAIGLAILIAAPLIVAGLWGLRRRR